MNDATEQLHGWKEILKRSVRCVQRWERREDLPVRRHIHLQGCTVYAFKDEIDACLKSRGQIPGECRVILKRSRQVANGLNPPPQVMRHILSVFRLWLAFEVLESRQDLGEMRIPCGAASSMRSGREFRTATLFADYNAAATVDGNCVEQGEVHFSINDRESIIAAGV